jgi:hypothetical protein
MRRYGRGAAPVSWLCICFAISRWRSTTGKVSIANALVFASWPEPMAECLGLRVLARADGVLEQMRGLLMIAHLCAHVPCIEFRAAELLELGAQGFLIRIGFLRKRDPMAFRETRDACVGLAVIVDHALRELLHGIALRALLCKLAQLHFGHAADCSLPQDDLIGRIRMIRRRCSLLGVRRIGCHAGWIAGLLSPRTAGQHGTHQQKRRSECLASHGACPFFVHSVSM